MIYKRVLSFASNNLAVKPHSSSKLYRMNVVLIHCAAADSHFFLSSIPISSLNSTCSIGTSYVFFCVLRKF